MIEIEKPTIECIYSNEDPNYGKFVVEPLERGYGTTLGNSLRRILLSSLPGVAVTSVKIDGILHEFSTIPGVKEDVTEIILNLKKLAVKLNGENTKRVLINAIGPKEVTAADILGDQIDILAAVHEKDEYETNDNLIIKPLPEEEAKKVEIVRGPNIKFLPVPEVPVQHLKVPVSLKGGDNISTDDITPASAEFSSMRSNIPLMSKYCYHRYDPEFSERAREMGSSIIIGGENYGQGSSREHAAINPMYLGIKCVIAKSIARIHKGNLVNHGIVPMLFEDPADYEKIDLRDELEIENFLDQIQAREVEVKDVTKGFTFKVKLDLTDNELEVVLCGGQLRYLKRELVKQGVIDKE